MSDKSDNRNEKQFSRADLESVVAQAAAEIVQAVAGGVSQGAAGNATAGAGQSAQLTASDTQHKTDVNVPELMTSLNGQVLASQTGLLQVINAALGLAVLGAQDHRDQNHTKQGLAVTFPFIVAGDAAEEAADDSDR